MSNSKQNIKQTVYLDKLVTSAHFPTQKGSIGSISKSLLPNLEHTGIQSTLGPQRQHCVGTDGNLLRSYKVNAFKNTKIVERPRQKKIFKEYFFQPNHRDFINKVLCEMEDLHLDKIKRRNSHWQSSVKELGFENSFSGFVEGGNNTSETFLSLPEKSTYYDDVHNNNEFNITRSNINEPNDDCDESDKHVNFSQSMTTIPAPTPLVPELDTPHSNSLLINTSNMGNKMNRRKSSSNNKIKPNENLPASRSAKFDVLLNTLKPPSSPIKRYGSLSSENGPEAINKSFRESQSREHLLRSQMSTS
jgi:hypothetical protein